MSTEPEKNPSNAGTNPVQVTSTEEPGGKKKKKKKTNGAGIIRYTTVVCTGCAMAMFGNLVNMCRLGLWNDQNGENDNMVFSPTLITLAVITAYVAYKSAKDLWKTCKTTRDLYRPRTWEEQHRSFKRLMTPFGINSILLGPTVMLFLLQSRGWYFFDLLGQMTSSSETLVNLLLVASILTAVLGVCMFAEIRLVLNKGLFKKKDFKGKRKCTGLDVISAILAFGLQAGLVVFSYCLISACATEPNSAGITMTVLTLLSFVLLSTYVLRLMCQPRQKKKWWLAFRVALGGAIFTAYITFWIILTLLALYGSGEADGFWAAVGDLNSPTRTYLIYAHLSIWLVYLLAALLKAWTLKIRKHGRQQRVWLAMEVVMDSSTEVGAGLLSNMQKVVVEEEKHGLAQHPATPAVDSIPLDTLKQTEGKKQEEKQADKQQEDTVKDTEPESNC